MAFPGSMRCLSWMIPPAWFFADCQLLHCRAAQSGWIGLSARSVLTTPLPAKWFGNPLSVFAPGRQLSIFGGINLHCPILKLRRPG